MSQRRLKLYVGVGIENKLNSITKYMECDRESLIEFLIIEAWKSIDAEKKNSKRVETKDMNFNIPTFVTEGEI